VNIFIKKLVLPLKEKFKISHSEFESLDHILISIEDKDIKAFGEIVPISFFNEPFERAINEAEKILSIYREVLRNIEDINDVRKFILNLKDDKYLNCIQCGFEMVLLDYIGKINKKKIWEILGLENPQKRVTPLTLPISNNFVTFNESLTNSSLIKIKLGGESDIKYLKYVQENNKKKFILDVNQGWTTEKIQAYAEYICLDNVLLLEEPVKIQNNTDLKKVRNSIGKTPLFLDESVKNLEEAKKIVDDFDGVNIKITKFGGLLNSIEAVGFLKSKNKKLMLGCFLESSLSISYAFSISSLFDYVDLDGATFIKSEPFKGATISDGEINMPYNGFGIGVQHG
jgi:L-alanine-DL-glutamate epimerase-like enolase superfamily enzyme